MDLDINNLPPMPRNRSHIVWNNKLVKTSLCRAFEEDLIQRLKKYSDIMESFKNQFNPKEHYIHGHYTIWTPRKELITASGSISQRSVDTDAHKVFRDILYKSLGIDDKFERDTTFYTPISFDDYWNYTVSLTLKPLDILYV